MQWRMTKSRYSVVQRDGSLHRQWLGAGVVLERRRCASVVAITECWRRRYWCCWVEGLLHRA